MSDCGFCSPGSHRRKFNTTQLPAIPLLFEPTVDETARISNLYYSIPLTDEHIVHTGSGPFARYWWVQRKGIITTTGRVSRHVEKM